MKRASLMAAAWLVASSAVAQGPGSAVKAAQTATRATTSAPTAPGLLIPPFPVGQVENCLGEGSLSIGTLRTSFLLNSFTPAAGASGGATPGRWRRSATWTPPGRACARRRPTGAPTPPRVHPVALEPKTQRDLDDQ